MCLSAIYWAGIDKIYYANTKKDAESIGFSDNFIYQELGKPLAERAIPMRPLMRHEAQQAFRNWSNKEDKQEYWFSLPLLSNSILLLSNVISLLSFSTFFRLLQKIHTQ